MLKRLLVFSLLGLGLCACSDQPKEDLIAASAAGDLATVERLLDGGADVNLRVGTPDRPITPLLAALSKERYEVARILVHRGAALDTTYAGISPYAFALWLKGGKSLLVREMEQR